MTERRRRAWVVELRDLRTGHRHLYTREVANREVAICQARSEHYGRYKSRASLQSIERIGRP